MATPTDFFDRQDHARRLTRRLLIMFALAVMTIIIAIYLVVAVGLSRAESGRGEHGRGESGYGESSRGESRQSVHFAPAELWNPQLFLLVAVGTSAVILLGSLYKISEMASGGETVALMCGGRPINPQTQELAERRLLNVVEEMALASGVPVPPVYVLENEPGINAFAAGHQPGDAVVAVSAGCLRYLSREELQGVLGHEFSHILNGDMRLNLRLIGVVYGILILSILGYYLLRTAPAFSSSSSSSDSRDSGGGSGAAIAVFLLGLALLILGYLGVVLGKLIKAAINRQREFLADASSVQFTRNPGGIVGALKKIGGLEDGSRIRDPHAEEVSHMFFGDAFAGSWFNLLSTHPPLADRIKAFEPNFDGRFPTVDPAAIVLDDAGAVSSVSPARPRPSPAAALQSILPAGILAASGGAAPLDASNMVRHMGNPQTEHFDHASRTIGGMPQPLLDAAREPLAAQAVIYSLLLSPGDDPTRARQMQMLQAQIAAPLYQETAQLAAAADSLAPEARLPLVDLAIPALKSSSPQQYAQFRQVVDALVKADGKVDLFEYCLRTVLFTYLDVHFGLQKPPPIRYRTLDAVAGPAILVLSMLAYAGRSQQDEIQRGFQAGIQNLGVRGATIARPEDCSLRNFDAALVQLAQTSPDVKRQIIGAMMACIAAEGGVMLEESELLRAVAAALGCPMPPLPTAG